MSDTLIEKLRSLPDAQLFEAIASRDLLSSLRCRLCIQSTRDTEYLPEQLVVEITSEALKSAVMEGLPRLDVIAFYHLMVEALECCGKL